MTLSIESHRRLKRSSAVAAAAIAGMLLVSACARSSGAAPGPSPAPTVRIGSQDDGRTIRVHVGSKVQVVLTSTYWMVGGSSDVRVLAPMGSPVTRPSGGCMPGAGCGSVTAVFLAAGPGASVVSASRTSCGEALRCTPASGSFRVVISVSR